MARRLTWKSTRKGGASTTEVEPADLGQAAGIDPRPVLLREFKAASDEATVKVIDDARLAYSYSRIFPDGRKEFEQRTLGEAVRASSSLLSRAEKPAGYIEPVLSFEELNYLSAIFFKRSVSSQAEYLELFSALPGTHSAGAEQMLASSRARFDDWGSSPAMGLQAVREFKGIPLAVPEYVSDCSTVFALAIAASQCEACFSYLASCEVYPPAAKEQDARDWPAIEKVFSSAGSLLLRLEDAVSKLEAKNAAGAALLSNPASSEQRLEDRLSGQISELLEQVKALEAAFATSFDACLLLAKGYGDLALSQMAALAKLEEFRAGHEEALVTPSDESGLLAEADVSASAAADIASSRGFKF